MSKRHYHIYYRPIFVKRRSSHSPNVARRIEISDVNCRSLMIFRLHNDVDLYSPSYFCVGEWIEGYIRTRGLYTHPWRIHNPLRGSLSPRHREKITHSDLGCAGIARLLLISEWYYYYISMSLGISNYFRDVIIRNWFLNEVCCRENGSYFLA